MRAGWSRRPCGPAPDTRTCPRSGSRTGSRARRPWASRSPSSSAGGSPTSSCTPPAVGWGSSASTRRCSSCASWAGPVGSCHGWWPCRPAAAPRSSRRSPAGPHAVSRGRMPRRSPSASPSPRPSVTSWCSTRCTPPTGSRSPWTTRRCSRTSGRPHGWKAASCARRGRPASRRSASCVNPDGCPRPTRSSCSTPAARSSTRTPCGQARGGSPRPRGPAVLYLGCEGGVYPRADVRLRPRRNDGCQYPDNRRRRGMDDRQTMRASDRDRQEVVDRLRSAVEDGRLKMDEYTDRMGRAYQAVTYGDLAPLHADLPEPASALPEPAPAAGREAAPPTMAPCAYLAWRLFAGLPAALKVLWTIWLTAVLINVVVWALVSGTTGHLTYPWPVWVAGPYGAALLALSAAVTLFRRTRPSPSRRLP